MPKLFFVSVVAVLSLAGVLRAQNVETPQHFDSNGKYLSVTPSLAVRAGLGPPEWKIGGDYVEARLFRLSSGAHIISVTRRDQVVERYDVTLADLNAIRQKVNAIPPQFSFQTGGRASSAFVRHQTLMGFTIYGPALAVALTNETTGGLATYFLTAGASFFAATQLARSTEITPERNSLATHMSLRGALMTGALLYAADAGQDAAAAGVFLGAIAGTATGLSAGKRWTPQEIVASQVGADLFGAATLGVVQIVRGDREESIFLTRGEAAVVTGMELTGYLLGKAYGRSATHSITEGDGAALWVTAALGAAAGSIAYAGRDVGRRTSATALTTGAVVGVAAGEVLLTRRFDLAKSEAMMIGLGSSAGALIGLGVARLIDEEGDTDARTMTFATAGGIAGLFATHFLLAPELDAGRAAARGEGTGTPRSAFQFNAAGVALTAARVPGTFPILRLTFQ